MTTHTKEVKRTRPLSMFYLVAKQRFITVEKTNSFSRKVIYLFISTTYEYFLNWLLILILTNY